MQSPYFWPLLACLVAVYLFIGLFKLSEIPLTDPDEPRYAAAGRTMSRGGSLLVPEFNGSPRINKPPLFYWAVALSAKICGEASEFSSRLPSLAMGLFMLVTTVLVGRRVFGPRIGLMAGGLLLSMPLFIALSHVCITDMTLSSFMSGALAFLLLAMLQRGPPARLTWIAAILFGLAILTKATPALALVLVVFIDRALSLNASERPGLCRYLPWILAAAAVASIVSLSHQDKYDDHPVDTAFNYLHLALSALAIGGIIATAYRAGQGWLKSIPSKAAILISICFGLWWYAALIQLKGWDEFRRLLSFEVGQRLAGTVHREPMYYYLPVAFAVAFPASIGLLSALWSAWPRDEQPATPDRDADRFLLAWFLGIILFFSIPGAKLATYILPAMPAAALLLARFMDRLAISDASLPRHARTLVQVLAGGSVAVIIVCGSVNHLYPEQFQQFMQKLPLSFVVFSLLLALGTAGAWLLVLRGKAAVASALLPAILLFIVLATAPSAIENFLEPRSTRTLCLTIKPQIADCTRVTSVGAKIESLSYYLDCTVHESRRRRVTQKRTSQNEKLDTPAEGDEPFDAVIKEELARPEKVALIIQNRYYARILGLKSPEFKALSNEEIARTVPAGSRFITRDDDMVVIRSDR